MYNRGLLDFRFITDNGLFRGVHEYTFSASFLFDYFLFYDFYRSIQKVFFFM